MTSVCFKSLININGSISYDETIIECNILYRDDDYIVASLSSPLMTYLDYDTDIRKYMTSYVRLNINTGDIGIYIPHDRSSLSISILESILSTEPDIVQAYMPISGHTWNIV